MSLIASAVRHVPHLAAFDEVTYEYLNELDLEFLFIYLIDTVPAEALPILGDQFDVMGFKGWDLTTNEEDRRQLIKNAIELHRYKGTPWAIRQALKSIGFWDAEIIEGIGLTYDGTATHDGTYDYGASSWANFRVDLNLGNYKGLSPEKTALMTLLINEYKNARSVLVGVRFNATLNDTAIFTDEKLFYKMSFLPMIDQIGRGVNYDGTANYDGEYMHNRLSDDVFMNMREAPRTDNIGVTDGALTINVLNSRGEIIQTLT